MKEPQQFSTLLKRRHPHEQMYQVHGRKHSSTVELRPIALPREISGDEMISKPEKNSHSKKWKIYKYEICGNIL